MVSSKFTFQHTIYACFIGYIVQAIVNNFVPLLFLTFQRSYGIPLSQITMLITFNFGIQLLVDLLSVTFVDRIGYRASMILANAMSILGFVLMTFLPELLPNAFAGLLISVMVYAIGGGLLEVLVSPIMESCPTEDKGAAMSLLHSFYCWGHVGVVLLSTLFFTFVGISHWKLLMLLWIIVPLFDLLLFLKVPIAPLIAEEAEGLSISQLLRQKIFWLLFIMMICSGASEQAVSQWASTLAEKGLGVSKTLGDLLGPMSFAIFMGISRAVYGVIGEKIDLNRFMKGSCILCVLSYLMIALIPNPFLNLLGCAITGLAVGIMWPGTFSSATAALPSGGTAMFALLALSGDVGCSGGPTFAGFMAEHFGDNLQMGILCAVIFPILLLMMLLFLPQKHHETK